MEGGGNRRKEGCTYTFISIDDAISKIDDVLTEHGGLLHVLPLAVHLNFFFF